MPYCPKSLEGQYPLPPKSRVVINMGARELDSEEKRDQKRKSASSAGGRNKPNLLSDDAVQLIRKRLAEGYTVKEIHASLGVATCRIYDIKSGKSYWHVKDAPC